MGNLLLSLVELAGNLLEQSSHAFLPVEHVASLLVTFDVVLNFLLEVLVNPLVFQNAQHTFVNFVVEYFVFVGKVEVLPSEILSLEGRLVKLALTHSD